MINKELARTRVRDTWKKIKQVQKEWDSFSDQGTRFGNDLVNSNIKLQYVEGPHWGVFSNEPVVKEKVAQKLKQKANLQLKQLEDVMAKLCQCHKRIKDEVLKLNKYYYFACNNAGLSFANATPLFDTLPLQLCLVMFQEILSMYRKDLFMKKRICIDICQQGERNVLLVYLASWSMQPLINHKRLDTIASIFEEEMHEKSGDK